MVSGQRWTSDLAKWLILAGNVRGVLWSSTTDDAGGGFAYTKALQVLAIHTSGKRHTG